MSSIIAQYVFRLGLSAQMETTNFSVFFSCDCLNNDPSVTEALDRSAAQYMFAFAQNIATFLETLDANWIDRYQGFDDVSPGILEMLFKKIYNPHR